MMAGRAQARGAAGVVVDGVVRDVAGLRAMGLSVHARGAYPTPSQGKLIPWESDVPIQCAGVLVFPGDYVIAAVHEKLGEKTMNVTVTSHQNSTAEFTFAK